MLPSSVMATLSARSVKPKKSMVITPVSVKSGSRVPSRSRRATAKLELGSPVAPGDDDSPVGLEGEGRAAVAAGVAGGRGECCHRHVGGAVVAEGLSGGRRASRRITDSSVTLPGGEVGGVVSAVPTSRSRPSGWTARSAPTKASRRQCAAVPERRVGLTVGLVAGDVGVVVDAHPVAAGVPAGAADHDLSSAGWTTTFWASLFRPPTSVTTCPPSRSSVGLPVGEEPGDQEVVEVVPARRSRGPAGDHDLAVGLDGHVVGDPLAMPVTMPPVPNVSSSWPSGL